MTSEQQRRRVEIAKAMITAGGEAAERLGSAGEATVDVYEAAKLIAQVIDREALRQIWDAAFGDAPALQHMRP